MMENQADSTADTSKVSAVIPVYNVANYLNRCLNSVVSQTRPFDEIILVDDGSTDGSSDLCDEWARKNSKIKVIHQQNGGLSAARNTGIKEYTGDYVTFIDSDDWISKDFVSALLSMLLATKSEIASCELRRVSSQEEALGDTELTSKAYHVYSSEEFMRILLRIKSNRTVHYAPGKIYSRGVVEENHFPIGILNEDVEGAFKFVLNARKVCETDRKLYYYYFNENSITTKNFGENYLNLKKVWQRVLEIAQQRAPQWVPACQYNVARADFTILCDMLIHGNRESDKRFEREGRETLARLRSEVLYLLQGNMVLQRKIMLIAIAAAFNPIRVAKRQFDLMRSYINEK